MKRLVAFVSAALFCVAMVPQQAKALGVSINAQGVVSQPMGAFGDNTGLGVGALIGAKVDVAVIVATFRAGYVHHLSENLVQTSNIPIMLGLRYALPTPGVSVFLGAEGGMNKSTTSIEVLGISQSTSADNIGMNAYLGANIGPLEITAGLNVLDFDNFGDSQSLMFTLGYDLFSLP